MHAYSINVSRFPPCNYHINLDLLYVFLLRYLFVATPVFWSVIIPVFMFAAELWVLDDRDIGLWIISKGMRLEISKVFRQ